MKWSFFFNETLFFVANGVSSVAEGVGNVYNGLTDRKQDAESSSRPKTN